MAGPSFEALKDFFEGAPVARKATRPLHAGAEVGLDLDDGPARFAMEGGAPRVADRAARDPDFTLRIPAAAVARLTAQPKSDVGALGIEFFKLVLEKDPALKVRIRLHASTPRLLTHGYLGVLAQGGLQVGMWLLKKGFANPKAAIDRLRGK
jgi:hypothetical protein